MSPLSISPPPFLARHIPTAKASTSRPHITLTWAQSLDAKIAGKGGARVMISGEESMLMTHWMRSMHDAILVGINTIILDDPRLQINLLPQDPSLGLNPPQPLILDPKLRFPITSRILKAWTDYASHSDDDRPRPKVPGVVKQPYVICGDGVALARREEVEKAGARVIPVELDDAGHIPPSALPSILSSLSLKSVMIEGGSRILSAFLRETTPRPDGSTLVDSVVVTVGPMFIGEGIGVVPEGDDVGLPELQTIHTEVMGKDAVMVCTVKRRT